MKKFQLFFQNLAIQMGSTIGLVISFLSLLGMGFLAGQRYEETSCNTDITRILSEHEEIIDKKREEYFVKLQELHLEIQLLKIQNQESESVIKFLNHQITENEKAEK